MCSKMKYFVLALFLDAVASSPYNIPRYNGNYNPEAAREEEAYIPRRLPSYMSPVPTAVDSEILRKSSNLRDPRSLNYNTNEREYSRTNVQTPKLVQSTISYANPASTLNDNEVLSHLLRLNRPIVNNVVEPTAPVSSREIPYRIHDESFDQLAVNGNLRSVFSQVEPLRIQSAPKQRIAFQQQVLTNVPDLDAYRPATPVKKFNIDREWSSLANKEPKLPDFIAERLKHPVDFQRSLIINQQVHKPSNAELPNKVQQYDIQKITSDQRIQNVLSSVKQTKRYLVIHPNGTVEHVDNLAPIAVRHPNYVLVNAGHVVPAKNPKNDGTIGETNDKIPVQVPAPTLEPITSSRELVISGSQLPEPIIRNEETVNPRTSSAETSTAVEKATSSESSIISELENVSLSRKVGNVPLSPSLAPETDETQEHQVPSKLEKSTVIEDESDIQIDSNLQTEASNSEGVEETGEEKSTVVESSSDTSAENDTTEVTSAQRVEKDNNSEDVSPVIPTNTSENDSNLILYSTQNLKNSEDSITDEINVSNSTAARRDGKPIVYYTSDPDFWAKVTDGEDSNFIYFFQVKSNPRVETDRQRTVYPDGTIIEELTKTVWDGDGGEPKVTKTSKTIHPDDL